MLFCLLQHYLDLYISDTTLKVYQYLYCFTTSMSYGVENYFPGLLGMGIFDAIFPLDVIISFTGITVINKNNVL